MLASFRNSSSLKLIQVLFGLIVFVMVASPLLSAWNATGGNPVLLSSSNHKITLKDLFGRDQNLLQTLYKIPAQPHSDLAQKIVAQYYRPLSYQNFFETYGCTLDDGIAWQWFIKTFGPDVTAEQYAALERSIQQQFGSRKAFISQIKSQFLAQKIQEQIADWMSPMTRENSVLSAPLQYTFLQYTFSPRDYIEKAIPSSSEELIQYYHDHLSSYTTPATMNIQAQFFQPHSLDLSQVDPERIQAAKDHLLSLGYEAPEKSLLQEQIYQDYLENLQSRTLYSLEEFALLYPALQVSSQHSLSQVSSETLDSILSQEGIFALIQSQFIDRPIMNEEDLLPILSFPSEEGLWILAASQYAPPHHPPYTQVAHAVLKDWTDSTAGVLAQQAAQNMIVRYKEQKSFNDKPSAQYVTSNLLSDTRFSDRVKIQLAHLIAADQNFDRSIVSVFDGQIDSGVKVFILDRVQFLEPNESLREDPSSSKLSEDRAFDLELQAQRSAILRAFDNSVQKNFGYTIQKEFWPVLSRFQEHQKALDIQSS